MNATSMLNKIEKTLEGWFKPLPHLPENGRKWIANNVWWINLVGLALSALAILSIAGSLITALSAASVVNSYMAVYGLSVYTPGWIISTSISMLSVAVMMLLMFMAIKPLKDMGAKGWNFLFIATLLSSALSVVGNILSFELLYLVPGLIGVGIGLAISMYFLFEIRSYFKKETSEARKMPKVPQPIKQ